MSLIMCLEYYLLDLAMSPWYLLSSTNLDKKWITSKESVEHFSFPSPPKGSTHFYLNKPFANTPLKPKWANWACHVQ